jgi:hypothetical protein
MRIAKEAEAEFPKPGFASKVWSERNCPPKFRPPELVEFRMSQF